MYCSFTDSSHNKTFFFLNQRLRSPIKRSLDVKRIKEEKIFSCFFFFLILKEHNVSNNNNNKEKEKEDDE